MYSQIMTIFSETFPIRPKNEAYLFGRQLVTISYNSPFDAPISFQWKVQVILGFAEFRRLV